MLDYLVVDIEIIGGGGGECFLFWGLGFKEDVFFYFKRGGGFVNMIKNNGLNRLLGILKDLRFDKIFF